MSKAMLRRLSVALKPATAKAGVAPLEPSSLAAFLVQSKEKYLSEAGGEWTVVMGNEAGGTPLILFTPNILTIHRCVDLDTLASSIAVAWIRSEVHQKPSIPLIQIARDDLHLRAENLHALRVAGIADPEKQLFSISDAPKPIASTSFALVDHNRLGAAFGSDNAHVVAVLDHHADEGLYPDADPRRIEPAGSCASHVATVLAKDVELPKELATLLLCAILIDTDGLKPGGKALQVDHDAAAYLIPLSKLSTSTTTTTGVLPAPIKALSDELAAKKFDVSHLGAWDLLRRDYKEYSLTLNWHESKLNVKAGLATVPVKLKTWGAGTGSMEREAVRWMDEQGLAILGVLTSFRDKSKFGKSGKGKHKREMAWFVKDDKIADRLWKGLEADPEVRVKSHKKLKLVVDGVHSRVYKQGNAHATRKSTAPLLKKIVESES
ncbi:putative exopolyphosphatase [Mycena indigotica]|uniref:Putative exopolyphosphatase n=1 Tax=Mycena indigotica TaxID=2126181 RepID=A0A8H6S697_9AGAR|nr:putative exopolyphosphatase [Mycena indigotica]KAF7292856.1 putative exopolyphosphatase [Mycena indigotica]